MSKKVSIVVQSRMGSQRIPGKMLRDFAGTTLVDILLTKLTNLSTIDNSDIYFCVGDQELIEAGKKYPINIIERSEASLKEEKDIKVLYDWHTKVPTDHLVMISACNPFLSTESIDKFIKEYSESDEDQGAISVYEEKNYFWNPEGKMMNKWPEGFTSMNTKFVEPTRVAAHCMYGSRVDLISKGGYITDRVPYQAQLITIPQFEAFDIDEEWQFIVGEKLYENI